MKVVGVEVYSSGPVLVVVTEGVKVGVPAYVTALVVVS
jgi:hypothetical protein